MLHKKASFSSSHKWWAVRTSSTTLKT
jgi:hypothetical protein